MYLLSLVASSLYERRLIRTSKKALSLSLAQGWMHKSLSLRKLFSSILRFQQQRSERESCLAVGPLCGVQLESNKDIFDLLWLLGGHVLASWLFFLSLGTLQKLETTVASKNSSILLLHVGITQLPIALHLK